MSRQFWTESLAWATADGTAITNTATETIIFPNITIPANYLQDGRVLRVTASGRYSNVVTAVPTMIFTVKWGGVTGTTLAQTPAITTSPTAITSAPWNLECVLQVRTNGSAGSIFAMGWAAMYTGVAPKLNTTTGETSAADLGLVASMNSTGTTVPAAVASLDLTQDTALALTAKWSVANAANSLTGHIYIVEALN